MSQALLHKNKVLFHFWSLKKTLFALAAFTTVCFFGQFGLVIQLSPSEGFFLLQFHLNESSGPLF